MNERETVYKYGNVVAVFVCAGIVLVLVDDLQPVGVYIRFVDKRNIFCQPVISLEIDTAVAFLQFPRFSTMLSLAFAICTEKNRCHSESVNCMPFKTSNCLRKLIIKSASVWIGKYSYPCVFNSAINSRSKSDSLDRCHCARNLPYIPPRPCFHSIVLRCYSKPYFYPRLSI